jgi:LPXTG-site transpeptidase (sortase) family protein
MNYKEWNLNTEQEKQNKKIRKIRILTSGILAFLGLAIIASQLIPLGDSFIQGRLLEIKSESLINPVPASYKQYIQGEFAYYDPGKSYFENLSQKAEQHYRRSYVDNSKSLKEPKAEVVIDKNYKKDMALSIDSVGIKKVNVSSNVASSDANVYNQYLTRGVAHFRGTPLPGDNGNSFIYGHSAVTTFFNSNPNLPETIFTRLENVDIGDTIRIYKDDDVFEYTVRRKKIIEPDDFSIFNHNSPRETLTLMTCWPIGIGSKRLIVIAELYEI